MDTKQKALLLFELRNGYIDQNKIIADIPPNTIKNAYAIYNKLPEKLTCELCQKNDTAEKFVINKNFKTVCKNISDCTIAQKQVGEEFEKYTFSKIDGNHNFAGRVYFIVEDTDKYIKIGYTSRPVYDRIRSLQCSMPHTLRCVCCLVGSMKLERYLHKKFSKYHHLGEWFLYSDEIKAFINSF